MTPFLASLQALVAALPALIELSNRLASLVERAAKVVESNGLEKWISRLEGSMDALENAKTPAEKIAAGRSLVDSIRHL